MAGWTRTRRAQILLLLSMARAAQGPWSIRTAWWLSQYGGPPRTLSRAVPSVPCLNLTPAHGTNAMVCLDCRLDSCPVIMIPKNFSPKEGAKLTDDLVVGKHISSGLQGGVYDLLNLDGTKANMVFKVREPPEHQTPLQLPDSGGAVCLKFLALVAWGRQCSTCQITPPTLCGYVCSWCILTRRWLRWSGSGRWECG